VISTIICLDLDGTLSINDSEWEPEYWKHRTPDVGFIKQFNMLKKPNQKLIVHTSRLESESKVGTLRWLQDCNVPFEAVHFDKPFYDFVVDDKAVTKKQLLNFMEKNETYKVPEVENVINFFMKLLSDSSISNTVKIRLARDKYGKYI